MIRRALPLLLLLTLLSACGARPLTLRTEAQATEAVFLLEGYRGKRLPAIVVTGVDGLDYSDQVRLTATEAGVEARLPLERRPVARGLDYHWILPDGSRLYEHFLYVRPPGVLDWQLTLRPQVALYHVGPLSRADGEAYQAAYERVAAMTGLSAYARRIELYLFPNTRWLEEEFLMHWDKRGPGRHAGFAWGHRAYLSGSYADGAGQALLVHELAHAIGIDLGPEWLVEGFATYFEVLEALRYSEANRKPLSLPLTGQELVELTESAQAGEIRLSDFDGTVYRDRDVYVTGYSFALFARARLGEEGVRALLRATMVEEQPVEAAFSLTMAQLEAEWLRFLTSGEMLQAHDRLIDG